MDKVNLKYVGEVLTVAGLIKELEKYDKNKPVFVYGECIDDGGYAKIVHEDSHTVNISKEV
jgi:hypothetical protein